MICDTLSVATMGHLTECAETLPEATDGHLYTCVDVPVEEELPKLDMGGGSGKKSKTTYSVVYKEKVLSEEELILMQNDAILAVIKAFLNVNS